MPSALFLCSGTGSVGEPFREAGWEVIDVDWDGRYNPTHVVDLMTWDCPYEPGHFDAIWCSPDCTQYSRARARAKTPRDLVKADALVKRCLGLIQTLRPKVWFLENPDSGLLRTRPFMQALSYVRVDYCCYQDPALYRKRTAIWTNAVNWQPMLCDRSHLIDGKHAATAQRGPRKGGGDQRFSRDELHRLPRRLCQEILDVCQSSCT